MTKPKSRRVYRVTSEEYDNDGVYLSWVNGYALSKKDADAIYYEQSVCSDVTVEVVRTIYWKGFFKYLKKEHCKNSLAFDYSDLLKEYTKNHKEGFV